MGIRSKLIFQRLLMQRCHTHFFYLKALIDHLPLFKNVCFWHYNIQTLKNLLKHRKPQHKIVISEGVSPFSLKHT